MTNKRTTRRKFGCGCWFELMDFSCQARQSVQADGFHRRRGNLMEVRCVRDRQGK